jgi:hypothetical protein
MQTSITSAGYSVGPSDFHCRRNIFIRLCTAGLKSNGINTNSILLVATDMDTSMCYNNVFHDYS